MGLAPRTRTRLAAALVALPLIAAPTGWLTHVAQAQPGAGVAATLANTFDPRSLTVPAGTTVTWTNEGGFHTVTGGEGAEDPSSPIGNNPLTDTSATVRVTFDTPGTYPYFCQPHQAQGMTGEIVVTAATGGAPAATTAPTAAAGPSGAPRPDANPSDVDPAQVDPGAAAPSASDGPGGAEAEGSSEIPGSTAEDNPTLHEIEEQRAAQEGTLGGFDALLWASTAALIALCVAVFASTRPRRASR